MTVGNRIASIFTTAGRSFSAVRRARKMGSTRAARPEVAGMANAVTIRPRLVRWASCRTLRAPVITNAAPRAASPVEATALAMTNAAISSHTDSSPRASNRLCVGIAPLMTSATAAPSAT